VYFPQIEQLQSENRILRQEFDKLYVEIDSVMYRLKQMEDWEDQLRLDKNIGVINRELRRMGTGGLPKLRANYPEISSDLNTQINFIWYKMDDLSRESSFACELREDLVDTIQLQEEMYRYTPSIYPAYGRISSSFGWRIHPISGRRSFHSGLDIANRLDSAIYATADGVVKETGYSRSYGRYIIVTHKFGYETMYAHLRKSLKYRGDRIVKGDIIANMGSSGVSTGSHVHYEVRRYGKTINPHQYLNKSEKDIIITKN